MRFFFYGTLMDADVRYAVLERFDAAATVEPAVLEGYRRVLVRGRSYPVALPRRGHRIDGVLARGLSAANFSRLTRFEGDEYQPIECAVSLKSGRTLPAWTYVGSPLAAPTVLGWKLETWQRRHKTAFLRRIGSGAQP